MVFAKHLTAVLTVEFRKRSAKFLISTLGETVDVYRAMFTCFSSGILLNSIFNYFTPIPYLGKFEIDKLGKGADKKFY